MALLLSLSHLLTPFSPRLLPSCAPRLRLSSLPVKLEGETEMGRDGREGKGATGHLTGALLRPLMIASLRCPSSEEISFITCSETRAPVPLRRQ